MKNILKFLKRGFHVTAGVRQVFCTHISVPPWNLFLNWPFPCVTPHAQSGCKGFFFFKKALRISRLPPFFRCTDRRHLQVKPRSNVMDTLRRFAPTTCSVYFLHQCIWIKEARTWGAFFSTLVAILIHPSIHPCGSSLAQKSIHPLTCLGLLEL